MGISPNPRSPNPKFSSMNYLPNEVVEYGENERLMNRFISLSFKVLPNVHLRCTKMCLPLKNFLNKPNLNLRQVSLECA